MHPTSLLPVSVLAAGQARGNLGTIWTLCFVLAQQAVLDTNLIHWVLAPREAFCTQSKGGERGELLKSGTPEADCKNQLHPPSGGISSVGSGQRLRPSQLCNLTVT